MDYFNIFVINISKELTNLILKQIKILYIINGFI